ncbi:NAD(P)-binding protein [Penicillium subrubescens]|uniref:NAD(P)-binding protein n=1 Tax=Penicillium subrubescens TaxID=1316194 RepID=UPI002544FFCD|nr:NAD(P)-binding protein [Penicillium subrubescens]KAJ5875611.1 NAD(P)-binding protein [Penicillium subrubescens]
MPHTLVTGANSFVAAHIISALIASGHSVTGSVRRAAAGEEVLEWHPEWNEKFEYVVISDYADSGVWDEIFKTNKFDHIVHVAAPMVDDQSNTDYDKNWLYPAVEGGGACTDSQIDRISGSINALTMGSPEENASTIYVNEFWNPITPEKAREAQNAYLSYCSSKKEAEKAVWDFVSSSSPHFSVTVLLPALIFGPPIQPVRGINGLGYSSNVFHSLWNNTYSEVPPTTFPSYIDVRDLAAAHLRALSNPEAANRRFLLGGEKLTYTDIVKTLAELSQSDIPQLEGRLPAESGEDENVVFARIDVAEGNRILGLEGKLRSKKTTFGDAAKRILELEQKFQASK